MLPRIAITRIWSDDDVAQLAFEVCDGASSFRNEAYVALDWGGKTAAAIRTFGEQVYGALFNMEAGGEGPEYASGSFRARSIFAASMHLSADKLSWNACHSPHDV